MPAKADPSIHWAPPPHAVAGNVYVEWREFGQHMLASTLVYFLIFLSLSQLRQAWQRRSTTPGSP